MSYDDIIEDDEARRRAIEEMMRLDRPRYFRDEAVQQEYRDILGRQEARQQGRERNLLAPGAEVSIPVETSAVGPQRRDRVRELTETQNEVQAGRDPAVHQNSLSPDPGDLLSLDAADGKHINDPRFLSDVTPDSDWTPGAQYAGRRRTPATGTVYDKEGDLYYQRGGHHEVPRGVYQKWNLKPETEEVFKQGTTGKLPEWEIRSTPDGIPISNKWTEAHKVYSKAIEELSEDFFKRHNIKPEDMTPDQARALSKAVRESSDARIRVFNDTMRLLRRLFRSFPTRGME